MDMDDIVLYAKRGVAYLLYGIVLSFVLGMAGVAMLSVAVAANNVAVSGALTLTSAVVFVLVLLLNGYVITWIAEKVN